MRSYLDPQQPNIEIEIPLLRLVLFTRYPDPGQAKTRLIPALGPEGAASVHRQLTENTVGVLQAALRERPSLGHLEIHITGAPIEQLSLIHI